MTKRLLPLVGFCLFLMPAMANAEPWKFQLAPYAWFAGLEGELATLPDLPPAKVDISPSDALEDLEGSFMVVFAGMKNGHGFVVDYIYTDVRSNEAEIPALNLKLRSTTKTTIATAAYQYEVYSSPSAKVDAMLGARYWEVDSDLRFKGGQGLLEGVATGSNESWIDPIVGFKGYTMLGGSKFFLRGTAMVGGFGVESDMLWTLGATLGYAFNDRFSVAAGYRAHDVDYKQGDYRYDARQEGWLAGVVFSF